MRIFGNPRRLARRASREAATTALAVLMGLGGWLFGPAPGARAASPEVPVTAAVSAWRAARVAGLALPDPQHASPGEVARFFATLAPAEQATLARRYPAVVGNLDGAPLALRYAANAAAGPGAAGPRQLLDYDPRGDGRIAQVFGDLGAADRIAVIVPGVDNTLGNFERGYGGRRRRSPAWQAEQLYRQLHADDPGARTAVVAWLGYDPPEGIGREAMREERAQAGAATLSRFIAGLDVYRPGTPVTLIGHSYGSVVAGLAAHSLGRQVRDIVALGSPGMGVTSVAGLHTAARVWAGTDRTDWTRDVPGLRLFGVGHGTLPFEPGFGARALPVGNVSEHDGYFVPGADSLRAIALITLGRAAADAG